MKRYSIVYDEDIGNARTGFMNFLEYLPSLESGDKVWEVEKGFEHRTDLISKKFYNTSIFDWVIEQVNDIKDPIKDVYPGRKLILPTLENIYFLACKTITQITLNNNPLPGIRIKTTLY